MSERGSGSGMDYLELKRRHDNYKNKQRAQNAGASRPLPGESESPAEKPETPAVAAPVPAASPAVEAQPVLRRGADPDEQEAPREIDLGDADEEAAEAASVTAEEADVGEPEDEPAPQDSQNPFNQFFVVFGKAREYMNARREKKRAAREEMYDDAEDDLPDESIPDDELGDEAADGESPRPAGGKPFRKQKSSAGVADEEFAPEDLPEAGSVSAPDAQADDRDDGMDEDWDDEDFEDEPEKKGLGLKRVMRLFVRPADDGSEAPVEEPEDAFNIDFEGFDEPFIPPIPESEKEGEPAAQTGGDFIVDEKNDMLEETAAVTESGLSRRERRELAMKLAREQAQADVPAEEDAEIAAEAQTESEKQEPASPAPIQTPAVPSIFDAVIPENAIAAVDEPTKKFKPVHAEEIVVPDEEEEIEPEKKGLFGRRQSRRTDDAEDMPKKGRASRRFDDDEDEDEYDRPRKKSRRDDYDDEDEYDRPKKKSRRDDYDDEDEYDRPKKKSRKDQYDDEDEYDRPKKKSRRDNYDDEDEYDEPRRSRHHDDIDYDDYDYNDDDGAGHGFVYHLTGFFKVVFGILIVLLALVIALNVWDYIGNRNGKDSPVDTMREHLRDYAPGMFDTMFPISADGEEPADDFAPDGADEDIGLGDGWDTPADQGDSGNGSEDSQPLTAG